MDNAVKEISFQDFTNTVNDKSLPLEANKRKIIGICGGPGSGKSTLAEYSVARLNKLHNKEIFAYLPMDGFHMNNVKLAELDLAHKKGAIETFEAEAYLNILKAVKAGGLVKAPTYSRIIHDVVEDDIIIDKQKVVITEGNYLLAQLPFWKDVPRQLDYCFFLFEEKAVVKDRLLARQKQTFKDDVKAEKHVKSVDLPNFDFINSFSKYADSIIHFSHMDDFA